MTLGYEGDLYILAFDHRGSFQKKFFGIDGAAGPEDTLPHHRREEGDLRRAATRARRRGRAEAAGVLVDEQFGAEVAAGKRPARDLARRCPRRSRASTSSISSTATEFSAHIESFDPAFSKVLVRYNPQGDGAMNARQAVRLKELVRLAAHTGRRFLFELLVPAEPHQLETVAQ